AGDVYACLTPDRGLGWSNSGLVNRGGGLVVDTFWDLAHTARLIATYRRVASAPVRRVVNTHHNVDHCWGNQLFRDAEIIAHRRAAEAMAKDLRPESVVTLLEAKDTSPGLAWFANDVRGHFDFREIEVTLPNHLIDGDVPLH